MQKQNEKEMEIVQFAWSLRWPTLAGPRRLRRERTEAGGNRDKVSLSLSLSLSLSQVPSGDTTFPVRLSDSPIASWNRDLNFGVDCAIRALAPTRVGAQRNGPRPDGHFKTNTRLSRTRKSPEKSLSPPVPPPHPSIYPTARRCAPLDFPRLQTGARRAAFYQLSKRALFEAKIGPATPKGRPVRGPCRRL